MRRSCAWFILGFLWLTAAAARADEARFQAFNLAIARDYLLPRYESLAQATQRQHAVWAAFCRQPSADGFDELRAAFQAAMDAWMPVQHIRTGPASLDSRIERIYFWPERKNVVVKQVGALLQSGDAAALAPDRFAAASVAIQGFPALQLLLYGGDDRGQLLQAGDQAAAFRCAYGTAVAGNLTALAWQLVEDWKATIASAPHGPAQATTQQLFTDLLTLFLVVGDFKLAPPLGNSIGQAKPKLAEGWRSGRSLRNIDLNLASARDMYGPDPKSGFRSLMPVNLDDDILDKMIVEAFDDTFAALAAVPGPLDAAVGDSEARPKVQALLSEVRHVRDLLAQRLAPAIGVTVGFNALDGD